MTRVKDDRDSEYWHRALIREMERRGYRIEVERTAQQQIARIYREDGSLAITAKKDVTDA